jgi:DNA-binding SARP family transcriptional activator
MNKKLSDINQLEICMLGSFTLTWEGQVVLEDEGRTHKVWTLLGYLLANHNRKLGPQELPELLCGDDRSNDPARTVKNLVYRLRCMLSDSELPEKNYIVQKGGIYGWNTDIKCSIDTKEFMDKYQSAVRKNDDPEGALRLYLEALDLYKGKFLPRAAYDEWAVTLTTYYHRIFTDIVFATYKLVEQKQEFSIMIPICEKAITIDPYEEEIYKIYIHCLTKIGRHKDALVAYESITNRLYDDMGVNPSKELRNLYRDIVKTLKSVETDLMIIKEDLNEGGQAECCYYCQYEIFKDIYRFIARGVERTGNSFFIMLCTLTDNKDEIPSVKYLGEAMESLKYCIGTTLRKSDVFARYSNSQYVIMLPGTSYENGCMVGDRIMAAYKKNKSSKHVKIHYKLNPLDPKA